MSTVGLGPMSMLSRANTALTDPSSASCRLSMPPPPGSALFTFHVHEGRENAQTLATYGAALEYSVVSGSMWSSIIAPSSANGLNDEPACRWACEGRSYSVVRALVDASNARIAPVRG